LGKAGQASLVLRPCTAQTINLQKMVFIFPETSSTAAVVLKTPIPQPLTKFTLLFSYSTRSRDNDLLLFKPAPNQYTLYLDNASVSFTIPGKQVHEPSWEHICVSWESATGVVELWLDGKPLPRMSLRKGYSVGTEASIILGQDQDSFGAGFESQQSFVGELKDVYMWDRVLSAQEMSLVCSGQVLSNYLINWQALSYEIKGYVVLKPSLLPSFC
uniref:Pentraxin family member n=1 Tax=Varanus komodoensis TaxID=61221 RepID=A0A8D2JBM5_VARKO